MMADNPRIRTLRRACAAGLVTLLALAGCKSKDGGGNSAGGSRDPLVSGNHIPPQNVPLPDRGGVGTKGTKVDPLIGAPTGKSSDRSGVGYNNDPARFKGPFVPGASTTPAALASHPKDGDELKIDTPPDNRVPLQPAGGVMPAGNNEVGSTAGSGVDAMYSELEKYGVKADDRSIRREGAKYVFQASVPISGNGARRQYDGNGDTPSEAVKLVLDQVIADRH